MVEKGGHDPAAPLQRSLTSFEPVGDSQPLLQHRIPVLKDVNEFVVLGAIAHGRPTKRTERAGVRPPNTGELGFAAIALSLGVGLALPWFRVVPVSQFFMARLHDGTSAENLLPGLVNRY
jgi:hypothetical protein